MTSKREEVLDAIKTLVASALPNADVKRNLAKPERIPPGGLAIIRDGDPGEPEVILSPLIYVYTHRIPIELAAYETPSETRERVLDGNARPQPAANCESARRRGCRTLRACSREQVRGRRQAGRQ